MQMREYGTNYGEKEYYDLYEPRPEQFFTSFSVHVTADEALQPLLSGQLGEDGSVFRGGYIPGQAMPRINKNAGTCFFALPDDGDGCTRGPLATTQDDGYAVGPLTLRLHITPVCAMSAG